MHKVHRCTHCDVLKPAEEFHPSDMADDGVMPWCKACVAHMDSLRASDDPVRCAAFARERAWWLVDWRRSYQRRYMRKKYIPKTYTYQVPICGTLYPVVVYRKANWIRANVPLTLADATIRLLRECGCIANRWSANVDVRKEPYRVSLSTHIRSAPRVELALVDQCRKWGSA